jgi:hypothetical protein
MGKKGNVNLDFSMVDGLISNSGLISFLGPTKAPKCGLSSVWTFAALSLKMKLDLFEVHAENSL